MIKGVKLQDFVHNDSMPLHPEQGGGNQGMLWIGGKVDGQGHLPLPQGDPSPLQQFQGSRTNGFTAVRKCLGIRPAPTSDPLHQIFLVWGEIQVLHQGVEGGDERSFHQGRLFEAADAGFCNTGDTAGAVSHPTAAQGAAQSLQSSTNRPDIGCKELRRRGRETK